jgi:hypothetical protein
VSFAISGRGAAQKSDTPRRQPVVEGRVVVLRLSPQIEGSMQQRTFDARTASKPFKVAAPFMILFNQGGTALRAGALGKPGG